MPSLSATHARVADILPSAAGAGAADCRAMIVELSVTPITSAPLCARKRGHD